MPDIYRQVGRLHASGIGQGFLSTLGERFLALLYEAIDRSDSSVLITRMEEGEVVGFVTGSLGLGPIYRALLKRPLRLAVSLAPVLLSPTRAWKVVELLVHSRHTAHDQPGWPRAELLSIVVAPAWRGRRVADGLYAALVDHFRRTGEPGFRIVVGQSLAPAHSFYRRMGARPAGVVSVHGGAPSTVYVQDVASGPRDDAVLAPSIM